MRQVNIRRLLCAVLVLAATLLYAAPATAGRRPPVYARIKVSANAVVYLSFHREGMRMALSAWELDDAELIKADNEYYGLNTHVMEFPEVECPVPQKALPFKADRMKAAFIFYETLSEIKANLTLYVTGDDGAEWAYTWTSDKTGSKLPSKAPAIRVPDFKRLYIELDTVPKRVTVRVAMRVKGRTEELAGISRDGKPIKANIRIVDVRGREIVSTERPLSKSGFDLENKPRCILKIGRKGKFMCSASIDAGPFGTLKKKSIFEMK